jgi:hypothetical protein
VIDRHQRLKFKKIGPPLFGDEDGGPVRLSSREANERNIRLIIYIIIQDLNYNALFELIKL